MQLFAHLISVPMPWLSPPAMQPRYKIRRSGRKRRPLKGDHGGAGGEHTCHSQSGGRNRYCHKAVLFFVLCCIVLLPKRYN
uniref:Uncharacterized protein n=1 Tax=Anguilla anguilla TaxID=7936 RepID=A0A0E9Q473_ANGAN